MSFAPLDGRILAWGDIKTVCQGMLEGDFNRCLDTGSANAIILNYPNYGKSTLEDGMLFRFRANASCTGATTVAITLAGVSISAKDLRVYRRGNSRDLLEEEIQSGNDYLISYRADVDRFFLMNGFTPSESIFENRSPTDVNTASTSYVNINSQKKGIFVPERSFVEIEWSVNVGASGTSGSLIEIGIGQAADLTTPPTGLISGSFVSRYRGYHNTTTGDECTISGKFTDKTLSPDNGETRYYWLMWRISANTAYSSEQLFRATVKPDAVDIS